MIRKIVITLLLGACVWPALAQRPRTRVEWGVIGGINVPDYTTNMSKTDVKNKLGWQAGIVTAVNLGAFAIEPQILYVRQGLRIKPEGAKEINLKSNSIDVPVLVSLRLLRPFRFYAGPVFTVMNDCKQKSGGDLLDFGRVRPTMSYTVGAGVKLLGHMLIDLRYNGQFKGKEDVVLPDGRVMELGKTVCKTSSGYSLLHLMIGSEGTLGVITELTLKLIPKPEMNVSLILPFADVETAIASVPKIKLANLDPQSIEFMERDIVDSSAAFTGNTIFPTVVDGKEAGAYILVTLVGDSEAELTAKMDRLGALAEQCGAYDTLVVWTDGLKKDVWAARSAFLTVIEADTKLLDEMDVVVPVDRIAEFLVYTRATGKAEGITIRNFGHAGDGNLHIYCCANDMALDEFKRRSKAVMDKCYAKCTEFGGQVSGEHAIGHAKKQYLVESVGETAFGLMQAIKQVFDPKGILNPGKVCTNVEEG